MFVACIAGIEAAAAEPGYYRRVAGLVGARAATFVEASAADCFEKMGLTAEFAAVAVAVAEAEAVFAAGSYYYRTALAAASGTVLSDC